MQNEQNLFIYYMSSSVGNKNTAIANQWVEEMI